MEKTVKVLWSGLPGRTGQEAVREVRSMNDVEIVAGIRREIVGGIDYEGAVDFNERTGYCGRWYRFRDLNNFTRPQPEGFDVVIDFSHRDVFERVVELAVRTHVPLISGTSGLSDRQMAMLYDATGQIPIFRGGNFRFKVKKFLDEAVNLAKTHDGKLILRENFYEGKSLPSETSKVLQQKILDATGKQVEIFSSATYARGNLICDWKLQVQKHLSQISIFQKKIHCRTIGFDELAHDVLRIAKVMAEKPIKRGEFYDLDEIWDDLVL